MEEVTIKRKTINYNDKTTGEQKSFKKWVIVFDEIEYDVINAKLKFALDYLCKKGELIYNEE